ncbi:MAG: YicC family protein [FCB group bacterium]|nr:YicC family protein [FCB group bacterium]
MNIKLKLLRTKECAIILSLESMTGFGSSTIKRKQFTIMVLCRSVNHKSLNISYKSPSVLSGMEYPTIKAVRNLFSRGRISVSVELAFSGDDNPDIIFDTNALKWLTNSAKQIAGAAGIDESVSIGELLAVPGILTQKSFSDIPEKELRNTYEEALDNSLNELKESRSREGAVLGSEFIAGFENIRNLVLPILEVQKKSVKARYEKLRIRIAELLADTVINEDRLMSELALMADRSDVTEEYSRLLCHINYSVELIESQKGSIGKKLGFFIQEIHRELNTMGSKVDDADISAIVIEMKNILASLKEQVANIE